MVEDSKKDIPPIAVRGWDRVFRVLGITRAINLPKGDNNTGENSTIKIGQYSPYELHNLPGYDKNNPDADPNLLNQTDFYGYLRASSEDSRTTIEEVKNLVTLVPEINQCKRITVSSIMSPTDMQTDQITIETNVPDLPDEINEKIGTELTNFFNDELEFGTRLSKWIGQALYETGSAPVMILPKPNIDLLNKAVDIDRKKLGEPIYGSSESLATYLSVEGTNATVPMEDLTYIAECALESTGIFSELKLDSTLKYTQADRQKAASELASGVVKLVRENQNAIVVTEDPQTLTLRRFGARNAVNAKMKELDKHFLGDQMSPTYLVSDDDTAATDEDAQAAIMELPSEAVVPVCVPGTKSEHIGYFVLVDQWGTPITREAANMVAVYGSRRLTQSSMDAVFGRPLVKGGQPTMTEAQRFTTAAQVFGLTIKNLLEGKMSKLGLDGIGLDRHEALTNCMFHYLLQKKKVQLIFVPESIMSYYRFDHRDDGTGKSLVEYASYVLALRTTLVISGIMAAMKNAMDRKIVEINVDEKDVNVNKLVDMIRNIFTEKNMLRFDNNPLTVARDITNKSLTIIPKGIKGLRDSLGITTDNRAYNATAPDDSLLEKLSNWAIDAFGVPHSALNSLSENEFSRTIATNNLYFSNIVRGYQRTTCKYGSKTIRNYIKYSAGLRNKVLALLNSNDKPGADSPVLPDGSDGTGEIKTNDDSAAKNFDKVLRYTKMTLPTPNVATDKAQYEELRSFIDMVTNLIDMIFPQEVILNSDEGQQDVLTAIKVMVKSRMIRDYIKAIGIKGGLEIPELSDFKEEEIFEINQQLINLRRGVDGLIDGLRKPTPDSQKNNGEGEENPNDEFGGSPDMGEGTSTPEETPEEGEATPPSEGEEPEDDGGAREGTGEDGKIPRMPRW